MKLLLVAVNSKYIHTNLAVRKIRAFLESKGFSADIAEFSGGEEISRTAWEIIALRPTHIGFSCYIWNIEYMLRLADIIKKADSRIQIIFGGPEAAYKAEFMLSKYSFIDSIVSGEGENAYLGLFCGKPLERILYSSAADMSEMPFPYTESELCEKGRIFYYESARGCPFSCTYCLSSAESGLRFKPLNQVFDDLNIFARHNVKLVKFIDRTFNADLNRSKKILKHILSLDCDTEFHIEISADTADNEFFEILRCFPPGKLRIEAGLQSANENTLHEIRRRQKTNILKSNIETIIHTTNVTLHLDLIAGLPNESLSSFKNSFNFAFALSPHELQLGFLKILSGTYIAANAEKYKICFSAYPPYEIIETKDISFEEIGLLKDVEAVLELYHNSSIIKSSEGFLLKIFPSPFDFFKSLAAHLKSLGLLNRAHHRTKLFDYIYSFAGTLGILSEEFLISLAADYFIACTGAPRPQWIPFCDTGMVKKEKIKNIILNDSIISSLPLLSKTDKIHRHKYIRIEQLFNMVWLISNIDKNIVDITPYF